MPNNMKKAGIRYKDGGDTKKKAKSTAKKIDDKLESVTGGAVNKIPGYSTAKKVIKNWFKKDGGSTPPDPSNYVGNAMGYYADKAAHGREMARQSLENELARRSMMKRKGGPTGEVNDFNNPQPTTIPEMSRKDKRGMKKSARKNRRNWRKVKRKLS